MGNDELDLSSEATGSEPLERLVSTRPFDPERDRERLRGTIALILLVILGLVLIATYAGVLSSAISVEQARELLALTLSPIVGLVGAATGFYYGGGSN